jgi:hypothetical protein
MDNKEIAKELSSLVQLDIDAVHAYQEAIDNIDHVQIREQLARYREDHNQHVTALSAQIRKLGEIPPEFAPDFKGYIIQGFTSLRSATGTEGALKAMHTNEKLTNSKYKDAAGWPNLPVDLRQMIAMAREDERRHIEYIEHTLEHKSWE